MSGQSFVELLHDWTDRDVDTLEAIFIERKRVAAERAADARLEEQRRQIVAGARAGR